MKFSTREDIDAQAVRVFAALTDFDHFAEVLRSRGTQVTRTDQSPVPAVGMAWTADPEIRGKRRKVEATVTEFTEGKGYVVTSVTSGLDCIATVDLSALPADRTRLHVTLEIRPMTIAGRVLLQPMRLAKASLNEKFAARIARYAAGIGDRLRGQ
jgi:hypothetical protein